MEPVTRRLKSDEEKLAGLFSNHASDRVFAYCGSHGFGDFVNELVYATTIAKRMNDSELTIIYPDDRPYRRFLVELVEDQVTTIGLPREAALPLSWFGISEMEPGRSPHDWWYERLIHLPNLFLTPSMMIKPRLLADHLRLKYPEGKAEAAKSELIRRGADPDRWIAVMHLREGFYADRAGPNDRNINIQDYLPVIERVYREGGQVIRVGDKSCTSLGSHAGLIEIMDDDHDLPLQCYAFYRARFSLSTDSGPSTLAFAFKIPTLITNSVGFGGRRPYDMLLLKSLRMADGRILNTPQQVQFELDHGVEHPMVPVYLTREWAAENRYIDNTPEQLVAATQTIIDQTRDCRGWRDTYPGTDPTPERRILWPPEATPFSAQLLDL